MYAVPKLPEGSVTWNLQTKHVDISELRSVIKGLIAHLMVNPKHVVGFDIEASNLNPHATSWDMTGLGFAIRTGKDCGQAWYLDNKFPSRLPTGSDLEFLKWFFKTYEDRIVVYNNSYELKGMWKVCGEIYTFQDARALVLAASRKGSLKANARAICSAHDWETSNSNFVGDFGVINGQVVKNHPTIPAALRQRRLDMEANNTPFPPTIQEFYTGDELVTITKLINWPRVVNYATQKKAKPHLTPTEQFRVLSKSGKAAWKSEVHNELKAVLGDLPQKAMNTAVSGAMQERESAGTVPPEHTELRDYDIKLTPIQNACYSMHAKGGRLEDILVALLYDVTSGWGGSPSRILAPYCGWDCFYTVILWDQLMSDPRLANSYKFFQSEIAFAGIMESYSICWDDKTAGELNAAYLRIGTDNLAELTSRINWAVNVEEEDPYGWKRELLQKLQAGNPLPFTYKTKYKKGGWTYKDSEWSCKTKIMHERWKNAICGLDDNGDEIIGVGEPTLVTPQWYIDEMTGKIEGIHRELADLDPSDEDNTKAINRHQKNLTNATAKLEIAKTANVDLIGKEITPEMYDNLVLPFQVKYIERKGCDEYIDEVEYTIANDDQRLNALKSYFFNPGSNTQDSKDKFWTAYLTPRMITAILFYGLRKELDSAGHWTPLFGHMADTEEFLFKDGEQQFDDDGDPLFVQKLVPTDIPVIQPDGSEVIISRLHVNMNNLQETISNMMTLCNEIPDVPLELVDASELRLMSMTKEDAEAQRERNKKYLAAKNLKTAMTTGIGNLSTYVEQYSNSFSADTIEDQHRIHDQFLGINVENPETWNEQYRMVMNMRLFKKCMKNNSTYIQGQKLGRGAVYRLADSMDKSIAEVDPYLAAQQPSTPELPHWKVLDSADGDSTKLHEDSNNHRFILETDFNPCSTETRRWSSRNHCLVGSTLVEFVDGSTRSMEELEKLSPSEYDDLPDIHSASDATGDALETKLANVILDHYAEELIEIELENGAIIQCTPDHRFMDHSTGKEIRAYDITESTILRGY
ncbi:coil containing protein [Vibrio phage 150E35-1]|nr:coil containing protein [Vibrio phage 150E35-1]